MNTISDLDLNTRPAERECHCRDLSSKSFSCG
jgi:hypothetical protein